MVWTPGGSKEVMVCSFETVVSPTAFRKWIVYVIVLSFGVMLLATEMLHPKGHQDKVEPELTTQKRAV